MTVGLVVSVFVGVFFGLVCNQLWRALLVANAVGVLVLCALMAVGVADDPVTVGEAVLAMLSVIACGCWVWLGRD